MRWLLLLTLTACTALRPGPMPAVAVFYRTPTEPFTEVGYVETESKISLSRETLVNDMRRKAHRLGANAIIVEAAGPATTGNGTITRSGSGLAVEAERVWIGRALAIRIKESGPKS
jgi:hypothetical protein